MDKRKRRCEMESLWWGKPGGFPNREPQFSLKIVPSLPSCDLYNLNATYHGIIIMVDQYLELDFEPDLGELICLHEQAQKLTILLVRTGDDFNLCAPINLDGLRTNGFCFHIARSEVSANRDNVVRISLETAVKFVSNLQQREVDTHPQTEAVQDWE
jgi:hypothetical protein